MSDSSTLIVGDIGGTNVRLARVTIDSEGVSNFEAWKQPGDNFATFEEAFETFVSESDSGVDGVCLGVAGVLMGGRARLLHRDWTIDVKYLRRRLLSPLVVVVNDFIAMARSAPELTPEDLSIIRPGTRDPMGSVVVGGPGTGFGLGTLRRIMISSTQDKAAQPGWVVVGGEGGHQEFTPHTDAEWKLAQRLRKSGVYVSNEVIASGSGFSVTLQILAEVMGLRFEPMTPEQVTDRARMGDLLSLEMCRLRARCVLAAVGDAALAANATGGVYLAGGVSAWLEPWLREPAAMARFDERGPRTELVRHIPIELIASDDAALIGAAHLWRDRKLRGWM